MIRPATADEAVEIHQRLASRTEPVPEPVVVTITVLPAPASRGC